MPATIDRWVLSLATVLALAGCSRPGAGNFQGYIEGDYVYVAAPLGGTLLELGVRRGDTLRQGQALFTLERGADAAEVAGAQGRLDQSRARRDNLRKGRRPTELAALEARLDQAKATLSLSQSELARRERLLRDAVISPAELDQSHSQRDADRAVVEALSADLETARLGGREDEIRAAEEEVTAAEAAVRRARWGFDQKSQASPAEAVVQDTLYEPGEYVSAGSPVVSLLPPTNLKVRFFVPQAQLSRAKTGASVEVLLDGVQAPVPATIRFVSTQPEFTPPVIFSREARQKLVFRVEAAFATNQAAALHPGQPVDVRLPP